MYVLTEEEVKEILRKLKYTEREIDLFLFMAKKKMKEYIKERRMIEGIKG